MKSVVHIRVNQVSPRLEFALKSLFNELLGIDFVLNSNEKRVHINYSQWKIDNCLNCSPHHLIYENVLRYDVESEIEIEEWEGVKCFYRTSGSNELPFDIFTATFFLLSRYEEYLPKSKDAHRRFDPQHSILVKHKLLQTPIVNNWALKLKDKLLELDPKLSFKTRKFEYISTIDVDQAWKFRNKGFKRNFLGFFRDLFNGKWENFILRIPVLLHFKEDPFHNFDYQRDLHYKHAITAKYFILAGKHSKFDKNIDPTNLQFQKLVKSLQAMKDVEVGVHPSYRSNYSQAQLNQEIQYMKSLLGGKLRISRQHFLKLKLPATYDRLDYYSIQEDYTMGYTSHAGFRAGIAAPFYYFDLTNNRATDLKLIPFCIMDITPLHYRKMSPEAAVEFIKDLMDEVFKVGGLFCSLWHNESLSETERWKGWKKVYEEMIRYAAMKQKELKKPKARPVSQI